MANNRMCLVHDESGQRVYLASHLAGDWRVQSPDTLVQRLADAFRAEQSGWGSTGWHLEFEHHSKHDDPLKRSSTETWEDADGRWHTGDRP